MGLRVPLGFLVTVTGLAFASVATSGCSGAEVDANAQADDLFGRGKVPAEWDRTVELVDYCASIGLDKIETTGR